MTHKGRLSDKSQPVGGLAYSCSLTHTAFEVITNDVMFSREICKYLCTKRQHMNVLILITLLNVYVMF